MDKLFYVNLRKGGRWKSDEMVNGGLCVEAGMQGLRRRLWSMVNRMAMKKRVTRCMSDPLLSKKYQL
jgi:hypothetical protein